jgi:dihydroflavonol-4-reductase
MNDVRRKTVLVTGGSGFIGSWMIVALLQRGYTVRATVRNLNREAAVRTEIAKLIEPRERLSFFAADLLHDSGWGTALEGCDFVMHVASPMPAGEFKRIDIIRPAREGTLRVLKMALRANVSRVVLTSSLQAALPSTGNAVNPTDEAIWTDLSGKTVTDYTRAKTLAEHEAWEFMDQQGRLMRLTTILPGMVLGPVLGSDYSPSVDLIARLLNGKVPFFPKVGFSIVDVRDLVELHIKGLESPRAAGQRFIGTSDSLYFSEIANILRTHFAARASKIRVRNLPDIVVRLLAHVSSDMRFLSSMLGKPRVFSTSKAAGLLGWNARPAKDTIIGAAESITREGLA